MSLNSGSLDIGVTGNILLKGLDVKIKKDKKISWIIL